MEPMRAHCDSMAVRESGNASKLRHSTAYGGVGLQNRGGQLLEELLEPPAAGLDLAGRNRNAARGSECCVIVDLIRTKGLLQPVGIIGQKAVEVSPGGRYVRPGIVCVQHQKHI